MNPIGIYFRGVLMGIADIIPGVSGGTIALITGIYPRFIEAIASLSLFFNRYIWMRMLRGNFFSTMRQMQIPFLINIGIGIISGILALSRVMQYLSENWPTPLWSFFFSLIFFSALSMLRNFKKNFASLSFLVAGIIATYIIITLSPTAANNEESSLIWFFICGVAAISAMLLPGISGSFILLLMGEYTQILIALNTLQWDIIIIFALGCGCGILTTSKLISWLLKNYYAPMFAFLCGVMFSSLLKLWPWKATLSPLISPTISLASWSFPINNNEVGLLPQDYANITGLPAHLGLSITSFLLAMIISLYLMKMDKKK